MILGGLNSAMKSPHSHAWQADGDEYYSLSGGTEQRGYLAVNSSLPPNVQARACPCHMPHVHAHVHVALTPTPIVPIHMHMYMYMPHVTFTPTSMVPIHMHMYMYMHM